MSHGWGGSIDLFDSFANTLAMQGIGVAALEYPCTNRHFEGGHEAGLVDYAEQPRLPLCPRQIDRFRL